MKKWGYLVSRLLWAGVATWVILTITFLLMKFTPNAQYAQLQFSAAQSGGDPQQALEAAKRLRGDTGTLWMQYTDFLSNIVSGNWGWSTYRSQPVTEALASAIPWSMMYGVPAVIISTILGMVTGLYSALNQYSKEDYAATLFAFMGISIPNFWFAIILLVVFGTVFNWVPILFDPSLAQNAAGNLTLGGIFSWANFRQFVLAIVVLTTGSVASLMRYSRAEALEYVEADFVKTARAKGVSDRMIVLKHILRPASIPLATLLVGDLLGIIFVGSYLVEVVFGIPGLGTLSYNAIINQDTALVFGTIFVPTFIAIVGNLAQDLSYAYLDPRISFGDDE